MSIYNENIILFDNENNLRLVNFQQKGNNNQNEKDDKKNKKNVKNNNKNKDQEKEEQIVNNENLNIRTEFKINVGNDTISDCLIYEKFVFCACQDNQVYIIDLESKKDLKYERSQMAIEDGLSEELMKLAGSKSKKKGKAKSKAKENKKKKK